MKILIVGAGGFGRELLQWIKDINEKQYRWDIVGFLDDDLHALDGVECDYTVVGTVLGWQPQKDEEFALAIGLPEIKEKVVKLMEAKGAHFASVIHPTATLTAFSHYGRGLIMFPYSKLSVNSTVGNYVTILSSGIGHDVTVGDYTTISGACNVLRNVNIGRSTFLSAGVSIAQDITVGNNCVVGLGSVVINDLKDDSRVFGNPARVIPFKQEKK